MVLAD